MPNLVPRKQAFVAIPGVVAVLDAVVAGATVGIALIGLDATTAATVAVGAVVFLATVVAFAVWGVRSVGRYREQVTIRFPSPDA